MWKDGKYLIAYLAPLATFFGLYEGGFWSFSGIYVGFVLIPLFELLSGRSAENLSPEEEAQKARSVFFDILLYLNVPILWGLIFYYFERISGHYAGGAEALATYEIIGMTCSVGLIVGTIGINVAHELGHRRSPYERFLAKVLLLSALYMHFIIEHNRGHHKNVATDEDPASARFGESLYAFWWRSVTGSYRNAWDLERLRLERAGRPFLSWRNEMLRFQIFQIMYLLAVGMIWGWYMTCFAVAIAVFGFLLLESVNYIEHYGLRRRRLSSGRYEKVQPWHSWNSDHEVGRIFLYELTRHSDHHYKATRKYQVLRHFDDSPQLPFGYPSSILISLVPPLWFRLMNERVPTVQER